MPNRHSPGRDHHLTSTEPGTSSREWITCHNPFKGERDLDQRTAALARVSEKLEHIATSPDPRKRRSDDVHIEAGCVLRAA